MLKIETQTYNKHIRTQLMGIAMILVVFYHISMHNEYSNSVQKVVSYIFGNGYLGVEIFFLLSSYGLSYSYNNNTLKRYYANRFIRLMPLYPLALILTYWKQGTPFGQACIDFVEQMSGIALFTNTKDPLWYIEALILLYVFFPLFYKCCCILQKWGGPYLIILICTIFQLILFFLPDFFLQLFVGRIPMMIVGIMTFLYDRDKDTTSKYILYGGLALIAITPILESRFFFVPAAMLLIARSNIIWGHKILNFIGKHTLEIFIAHHFAQMCIGLFDNYYITLSSFFFITIVLSFCFYFIQKYSLLLFYKLM